MAIKKGDFVEIEYTGKTKDEGIVFDTTDLETAKQNNIFNERYTYGPIIICVGENQVLKGIDKQLEGKEPGSFTAAIATEDAFGKKSAKLLRMIPLGTFKKQNIAPYPGLQLNMDGVIGTVKTVQGVRTIVDFNHPLSSKDLVYEIKANRIVEDDSEKIRSYLQLQLSQKDIDVKIQDNKATVATQFAIPKEYTDKVAEKLKELTGKEVIFQQKPEAKGPEKPGAEAEAVKENNLNMSNARKG